jgi:hypothetical protein
VGKTFSAWPTSASHHNYFDLGGTSWQAMSLFAEIEKLTGHYLPLSTLVQSGTVAELADVLRNQSGSDPWPTPGQPAEWRSGLPPSF